MERLQIIQQFQTIEIPYEESINYSKKIQTIFVKEQNKQEIKRIEDGPDESMESNVKRVQIEVADNQNIEEDGDTY